MANLLKKSFGLGVGIFSVCLLSVSEGEDGAWVCPFGSLSVAFVTAWNSSHTLVSEVLMIPAFAIICFSPSSLARGPSSIAALAAEMSSHTLVISACLLEMCSRIYMDFPVNFL
ncbi:unnamed protein product [Bathycoccus prasinos]